MMTLFPGGADFRQPSVIVPIGRFAVWALCVVSCALATDRPSGLAVIGLTFIAAFASIPMRNLPARIALPLVEAVLVTTLISAGLPSTYALLPYLVVPCFAAGYGLGILPGVLTSVTSMATFAMVRIISGDIEVAGQLVPAIQWLGMGLTAAAMSGWARSFLQEQRRTSTSYAVAHQLLTELREVSRQLPTGLDEVALAQEMLASVDEVLDFDRGAVYSRDDNGVVTPLAYRGADRLDWNPASSDELWTSAFGAVSPLQRDRAISPQQSGNSAFLSIKLADRPIGLVAVERGSSPWSYRDLLLAQSVVDEAALRIETGQLFSEVRSIATVEERRRLAREIHDGIAQELASLGYVVDDLSARTMDPEMSEDLQQLRSELTRMVSELRLSIFDLRSDVQPSTGLGAALSSYVRSMSTGSGITMHMILDESSLRLPIEVETEVLRIAQESITNARKHARARNLWVTCRVDPPKDFLRVADDGQGLGSPRGDSYGLEIMRERADRVGAELSVRQRVGGGTVVELVLGGSTVVAPPASVRLDKLSSNSTPSIASTIDPL